MLIINSIVTEREIYQSVLNEPSFYRRYLLPWVREGMEEKAKIEKSQSKGELG